MTILKIVNQGHFKTFCVFAFVILISLQLTSVTSYRKIQISV